MKISPCPSIVPCKCDTANCKTNLTGSTFEQDLDLQMDALEKEGCDRIFCDQGESGTKDSRPEWNNCLDHLRQGDTLVIWKLDRASRSTKHLVELAEDLKQRGVKRKSLKEQIDTSTAMGKFFFQMTASIAELERDIIRDRTLSGLAAARAGGRKGGRKKSIRAEARGEAFG